MLVSISFLYLCFAAVVLSSNVIKRTATSTVTVTKTRHATTSTTQTVTLTNTVTSYHQSVPIHTLILPGHQLTIRGIHLSSYITRTARYSQGSESGTRLKKRDSPPNDRVWGLNPRADSVTTTTVFTTKTTTHYEVQGEYTYVTKHPNSTLTHTVTSCVGVNPTPDFHLQVIDATPTRTDTYNMAYVTPVPDKSIGRPFHKLEYVDSISSGGIFNIDCLGRLITTTKGSSKPLFANFDYFFTDFQIVRFLRQKPFAQRGYIYIYCHIANSGYLRCSGAQAPPTKNLTMFQTCPLYDEYFGNPMVIANYQSTDAPECFGLRLKPIPA